MIFSFANIFLFRACPRNMRRLQAHCRGPAMNILAMILLAGMLSGCGFFGAELVPPPASSNKIVRTAQSQMGKKYCPGGASPQKGFDCSGLIWWSYRQHGLKIPRITTDQAKVGQKVPPKLARAGDIMVFRVADSPRGLHTGIYAGKGCFIHSPGSGRKVCMARLYPYWNDKLVAIRRVVQQ